MLFVQKKALARAQELYARRFLDMTDLTPLDAMDAASEGVHAEAPDRVEGYTLRPGDHIVGRDRYVWIRKTVEVPQPREGCRITALFDLGETGGGFNSKFESTLFIDRVPQRSVDMFHNTVFLDDYAGKTAELTLLFWSGLEGGGPHVTHYHRVKCARIGYMHMATDELAAYMKAAAETLAVLPEESTDRVKLEKIVEETCKRLNFDADKLHATVPAALAYMKDALAAAGKRSDVTVNVVGHTHIDVAWLWRLKHTEEKSMRSFGTQLALMREFPEFIFMSSQAQLYKYVKKNAPALMAQIRQRVREGRWEPDGGMWVEADCNLTSGESLTRQFIHGMRLWKEEFGTDCTYLWLPDVFGYSWALPQIMKLCGIPMFMTTKIAWSQFDRMPHDLFRWRGIDGSEVDAYFMTTPTPGQPESSWYVTYNDVMVPETVTGAWKRFRDKDVSREVLVSYGYGDGGGGVTREMLLSRRAMDAMPGLPNVKPARPSEVFARMRQDLADAGEEAPVWDGELYLEYHRGTYTTQSYNKKMNRRMEFDLAEGEWLDTAASMRGGAYDAAFWYDAWETVLLHQFHDIIPGSSIREVYEDAKATYTALDARVRARREALTAALTARETGAWTLSSFAAWPGGPDKRREPVLLSGVHGTGFTQDGQPVQVQESPDGVWAMAELPKLGSAVLRETGAVPAAPSAFAWDPASRTLTTPQLTVRWNAAGQIESLVHAGRETLSGPANVLEIYEDKPMAHDAWDIDIYYTQKRETATLCGAPEVVEDGALRFVLRFVWTYNASRFVQDVTFWAHTPRVDFVTQADWHEDHRLLKAAFPAAVRATSARYDIQYGFVERPTHQNTSWDLAKFEVCAHKWADVSQDDFGAALLNDCKYGHNIRSEGQRGNVMRISLLKAPKAPDTEADMGTHAFTYAFLPHEGSLTRSDVIAQSTFLNLPVRVTPGAADGRQLFRVEGNVNVDAVKRPDDGSDGVILRIHEGLGGAAAVRITSDFGIRSWQAVDLPERPLAEPVEDSAIEVTLRPFEIRNFLVRF